MATDADREEEPVEADMTDEIDTADILEENPECPVVSGDTPIENRVETYDEVLVKEEDTGRHRIRK